MDIGLFYSILGRIRNLRSPQQPSLLARKYCNFAVSFIRHAQRYDYLPTVLLARAEVLLTEKGTLWEAAKDIDEAERHTVRAQLKLAQIDCLLLRARMNILRDAPAHNDLELSGQLIAETGYFRRSGDFEELRSDSRKDR